jgi:rubrerythrin
MLHLGMATLIVLALICLVSSAANAGAGKTLDNLMAAYNGESNANAKYLAYAKKADEEGYGAVASLFRAASKAEEVHASRHAEVITALGGTPAAQINLPEIGTTKENLADALKGESYERDTMYPEFLAAARAEGQVDAIRAFNFAKTAEAEHAKFYQSSLDNLESLKGSPKTNYYVCTVCGNTVTVIDFDKCPSCFEPKDRYVEVS